MPLRNKLDELKAIVEKRKTFIRFKTSYTIHNNKIINDKILFLDDTFNIKSLSSTATANAMKKNYFTKTNNYNSNNNNINTYQNLYLKTVLYQEIHLRIVLNNQSFLN